MKAWQDQYNHLKDAGINVNISSKQLSQPNFTSKVVEALQASGLKAESLSLEITEGVLIKNYSMASEIFSKLRKLGVQLQIDDFGTGYSALGYLQYFPINAIKIDKTFVHELGKSRRGTELVRAIVSMARELGMETIAEGIETKKQLSTLQTLFCSYGQGYLLSEPFEPTTIEKILTNQVVGQPQY